LENFCCVYFTVEKVFKVQNIASQKKMSASDFTTVVNNNIKDISADIISIQNRLIKMQKDIKEITILQTKTSKIIEEHAIILEKRKEKIIHNNTKDIVGIKNKLATTKQKKESALHKITNKKTKK
jgi:hypothetical protein